MDIESGTLRTNVIEGSLQITSAAGSEFRFLGSLNLGTLLVPGTYLYAIQYTYRYDFSDANSENPTLEVQGSLNDILGPVPINKALALPSTSSPWTYFPKPIQVTTSLNLAVEARVLSAIAPTAGSSLFCYFDFIVSEQQQLLQMV